MSRTPDVYRRHRFPGEVIARCAWLYQRECLDHILILSERQLRRALAEYVGYFNRARPHHGIGQRVPMPGGPVGLGPSTHEAVLVVPVLPVLC